jgi:hypothetical protein
VAIARVSAVAVAIAAAAAALGGCGRDTGADGGRPPAARTLDCAAFADRVQRCAADFWSAYAATERARANAAPGDVAGHVGEVRATFEAVGLERLCANERQVHGDDPAWTRTVDGCAAREGCAAWAGCAAPALFDGPARR